MKEIIYTLILFVICLGGYAFYDFSKCKVIASNMEVEFKYPSFGLFQGCMIKINNKWIPYDKYRAGHDD
jgi:hypothetical protein